MSNCRLCQHQLWILLLGIVAMGSYWQMVLDHLGCRMFPSFIKEEKSERVLIITATREILRGTRGMMPSLSSTFSRQLSQFPKHTNHTLELCVKHQVRNSMTNMWWRRCCFHRWNDCVYDILRHLHILTLRTQSSRAVLSALTFSLTHLASVTGRWCVALPPSLPLTLRATNRPLAPLLPDSIHCRAHNGVAV